MTTKSRHKANTSSLPTVIASTDRRSLSRETYFYQNPSLLKANKPTLEADLAIDASTRVKVNRLTFFVSCIENEVD